jgi:acyl-CoA thioesterase I
LPEPEGPTSPTDCPASISSEMPLSISTGPALPCKVSRASRSDRTGSGMKTILWGVSPRYGALRGAGKRLGALLAVVFTLLAPVSVAAQALRITALGDSLTQGYGLMTGEGLVPQLEAWLRARGHDVSVLNAGSQRRHHHRRPCAAGLDAGGPAGSGDRGLGGQRPAARHRPCTEPGQSGRDPDAAEAEEGLPVLLVGLSAPGNYGPEYQAAFDGDPHRRDRVGRRRRVDAALTGGTCAGCRRTMRSRSARVMPMSRSMRSSIASR